MTQGESISAEEVQSFGLPGWHLVMYFRTSSTRMTGKDSQSTASHSEAFSGVTENMAAAGGTYRMKACSAIDSAMDPSSHRLPHGGSCSPHQFHDRLSYWAILCWKASVHLEER